MQQFISAVVSQAKNLDATQIYVTLGVLVGVYLITVAVKRKSFPPGPWGWLVVGYLPHLSVDAHLDFTELGKKYGDVLSVKLGSSTVVVLNGVEAIKEALGKPEFLGRDPDAPLALFLPGSVFFVEDVHSWREHRRFVVHAMKDLGLGKTIIEGEIMDEVHHFLEILSAHKGNPLDLKEPLSPSMSNNICSLVFGKRYEYQDKDRIYLDSNLGTAVDSFSHTSFAGFFPWILRLPFAGKLLSFDEGLRATRNMKSFLKREIKKHKKTFDSKNVRDFIDSYIVEMEARKKKDPDTTITGRSDVLDLFVAGSETVRTTILWMVYVAAAYPEVQEKVRREVLEVMGTERDPEVMDLRNAPLTHSFILEVMRWKTIVPLNVPRYTTADATVGGYTIPKNTTIITNLWNAHHSPDLWTDPEKFVPERFIAKDGKTVSRPSHFMPFSMGKRVCPGEAMAIMEMFLYFTSILRKFDLVFPEGYTPTYKAVLRGTYTLEPYKIRFVPRS